MRASIPFLIVFWRATEERLANIAAYFPRQASTISSSLIATGRAGRISLRMPR